MLKQIYCNKTADIFYIDLLCFPEKDTATAASVSLLKSRDLPYSFHNYLNQRKVTSV